jgi:hypothetical protein
VTLGASSRDLSSWPNLSRPSTPRRLNDVSDIATAGGNVLGKQCFPSWPLGSKNFDALAHMEGRDEPGMTLRVSATTTKSPTTLRYHVSRETGGRR